MLNITTILLNCLCDLIYNVTYSDFNLKLYKDREIIDVQLEFIKKIHTILLTPFRYGPIFRRATPAERAAVPKVCTCGRSTIARRKEKMKKLSHDTIRKYNLIMYFRMESFKTRVYTKCPTSHVLHW